MRTPLLRTLHLAFRGAAIVLTAAAFADGTPFFSADQVTNGRLEYSQKCAVCHGSDLQGAGAPAMKGKVFVAQWNGKTLQDFYGYVHSQMPLGQAASLNSQEYADIVSYVLAQNGVAGGHAEVHARPRRWIACSISRVRRAGGSAVAVGARPA